MISIVIHVHSPAKNEIVCQVSKIHHDLLALRSEKSPRYGPWPWLNHVKSLKIGNIWGIWGWIEIIYKPWKRKPFCFLGSTPKYSELPICSIHFTWPNPIFCETTSTNRDAPPFISDLIMSPDFQIRIHYVAISLEFNIYIYTHHNYCWFKSQLFQYSHHFPISPAFLHDFPMILAVVNAFRP